MKTMKLTEVQIAVVLKDAEGGPPVGKFCRRAGVSDATFYNWRRRYAGLMPSEIKQLRQLEEENVRLKRVVADLMRASGAPPDIIFFSKNDPQSPQKLPGPICSAAAD